ncbi:MAG: M48 family metallopeptidase [Tannerellaceae bacterium]|nr:M48 family metallopeptidase [Tannerellaceae bacterium]
MEKQLNDKELGMILLRTHPRATRYTLKVTEGRVIATIPVYGDEQRLLSFIEENRLKLLTILQTKAPARKLLDETSVNQYTTFRLHIFRTARKNFYMRLEEGVLHIACPEETVFEQEAVQQLLRDFIERALRHEANRLLPGRTKQLAVAHGFTCRHVKITKSKSRWGSCSSGKDINLSLSLMTLPWHLIDYVLLHELCHTIEMNHSDRFWALMNRVTDNKALLLRKELKSYHVY